MVLPPRSSLRSAPCCAQVTLFCLWSFLCSSTVDSVIDVCSVLSSLIPHTFTSSLSSSTLLTSHAHVACAAIHAVLTLSHDVTHLVTRCSINRQWIRVVHLRTDLGKLSCCALDSSLLLSTRCVLTTSTASSFSSELSNPSRPHQLPRLLLFHFLPLSCLSCLLFSSLFFVSFSISFTSSSWSSLSSRLSALLPLLPLLPLPDVAVTASRAAAACICGFRHWRLESPPNCSQACRLSFHSPHLLPKLLVHDLDACSAVNICALDHLNQFQNFQKLVD